MSSADTAIAPATRRTVGGRTRITENALQQVVAAVAGDALGVSAKRVDTDLDDNGGALDITAHAPIRVISIARLRSDPRSLERSGGSVLERCSAAEQTIRDRVKSITGYTVQRVTVRLTDIDLQQGRRVR